MIQNFAKDKQDAREQGEAFISLFMRLRAKGIEDTRLFAALEKTPRALFVEAKYHSVALDNCLLPLACGEYIERLDEQMRIIEALKPEPKSRVLEIGAGSGFTAAILARLSQKVNSLERYKTLADEARQNCSRLGLKNVSIRHADACREPRDSGPFDRIILWPAVTAEPQQFINLLAGNGILIAPVGPADGEQTIMFYSKTGSRFEVRELFKVRYAPLTEGLAAIL